jgi:hypothetical protein
MLPALWQTQLCDANLQALQAHVDLLQAHKNVGKCILAAV